MVGIVSELTGYPPELLDVDLDLEADLGVDTVKQAEIFAAIREHYGVARDDSRQAARLSHPDPRHRLDPRQNRGDHGRKSAEHRHRRCGTDAVAVDSPRSTATSPPPTGSRGGCRYPCCGRTLAACVPTGVTLGAGTRVAVMRDHGGVADALITRLTRLGVDVVAMRPDDDIDTVLADARSTACTGWRRSTTRAASRTWTSPAGERRCGAGYATSTRRCDGCTSAARSWSSPPAWADTTATTRPGATCPLGGAVTGFAKAYRRERPDALVKAVDFPVSRKTAALADVLVDETLRDPGCVEVGHAGGPALGRRPGGAPVPRPHEAGEVLGPDPVFVVTGAAGSIVSAITADLAAAWRGTFHLLDLTPEPDPADPICAGTSKTGTGSRPRLAARMRRAGRAPDAGADRAGAGALRAAAGRAGRGPRRRGRRAGTAHYHSVDLTDAGAVEKVIAQVRDTSGRIDVLLHAAGVEISHALPDKEPREFDLVLGVKGDGLFNVLHAVGDAAARRRRGVQLGGRPVRQRRADRLQRRQRPAVQDA